MWWASFTQLMPFWIFWWSKAIRNLCKKITMKNSKYYILILRNAILGALIFSPALVFSYEDQPYRNFNTQNNTVNKSEIVWRQASDINEACERESRRLGNKGFGYALLACSFWERSGDKTICTIITSKATNLVTLGHEVRHCFQGEFHWDCRGATSQGFGIKKLAKIYCRASTILGLSDFKKVVAAEFFWQAFKT